MNTLDANEIKYLLRQLVEHDAEIARLKEVLKEIACLAIAEPSTAQRLALDAIDSWRLK
jgi:hypothetical protein